MYRLLTSTVHQLPLPRVEKASERVEKARMSLVHAQNDLKEASADQDKAQLLLNQHKIITLATISKWMLPLDSTMDALSMVLHSTPLKQVDQDPAKVSILKSRNYNVVLPGNVTPSNQMYSGRCWMFAGLNILRRLLILQHDLKPDFELSQSYLFFWHYFEQYNEMLNLFFYKKKMPQAEKLEWLGKPLHDGGNWITFRRLSQKYGVVPKKAYRESWPSSHSSEMNTILCQLLQNDLMRCHKITNENDFIRFRDNRLQQVLQILCSCMGTPPMNEGLISLRTSKNVPIQLKATPLSLLEMLDNPICIDQHIQIIHDPRATNLTWHKTQYQDLQSIQELFFNVTDMSQICKAVTVSLAAGRGVWFACNMNEDVSPAEQGMAHGLYRPDKFIPPGSQENGNKLSMKKIDRMNWGRARCNHAMLIVGVETDPQGVPKSFKIENSWGASGPGKGFYKMTADWFHEHVYTVVIHRDCISSAGISISPQEKISEYPYYDIFG